MEDNSGTPVLGGKFRLLKQIGEGGMGVVWEAEHIEIGRRVAIKVLSAQSTRNPEVVRRFRREAQVAGQLGHDNICEVLDIGTTPEGAQFLVMPLLRGSPLSEVIASHGQMPIKQAIDITSQILSALAVAHEKGVIHRDLKPENVFITSVGDRGDFVKVLDFGISKVLDDSPLPVSDLTRTGTIMGTPYYMAPEQARGHKDQDRRVDIYATGVMLYEILTGRRPFEADSYNALLIRIVTEPFKPPRTYRPDLSARLEAVVMRAMAREREERYPDALAMRADLVQARLTISETTGPVRISVAPTDRYDPPRTSPDAGGPLFGWSDAGPSTDSPAVLPAPAPGPSRPRSRRWPAVILAVAFAGAAAAIAVGVIASDGDGTGEAVRPPAGAQVVPAPAGAAAATAPGSGGTAPAFAAPAAPLAAPASAPAPAAAPAPSVPSGAPAAAVAEVPAGTGAPAPATPRATPPASPRGAKSPALIRGRGGAAVVTTNR